MGENAKTRSASRAASLSVKSRRKASATSAAQVGDVAEARRVLTRPGCGHLAKRPSTFRPPRTSLAWSPSATALLQFLDALGPVILEETRQRAVGQHFAVCLAARAVVRLVLRVNDALDGATTDGTRLAVPPMH